MAPRGKDRAQTNKLGHKDPLPPLSTDLIIENGGRHEIEALGLCR
jgi:hypothetical protein